MVCTPTISMMLEEGKSDDLYTAIRQDGQEGYWGMQTMNQALEKYVVDGVITEEDAMLKAGNVSEMKQMLRRRMTETTLLAEKEERRARREELAEAS
jgi:twitching motility protein PilT